LFKKDFFGVLKFSQDLSFDFELRRVRDGNWGGVVNGKWNGLVAELMEHQARNAAF